MLVGVAQCPGDDTLTHLLHRKRLIRSINQARIWIDSTKFHGTNCRACKDLTPFPSLTREPFPTWHSLCSILIVRSKDQG